MSTQKTDKKPISVPPSRAWDGNDGPWSTFDIHVGTPPQKSRVLVSTTIGETWVISDNKTQGGCRQSDSSQCPQSRGGLFNINASTTWHDKGIFALGAETNLPDYIGPYDNGNYGLESLGIGLPNAGGLTLKNQVVAGLATKDFYLGNLGVTSRPTNFTGFNNPQTSFLSSLKEQNRIPSLSFGYTAGNQYRLTKVFGSLTLGGYDQSRFIPNDVSFPFAIDISRDLVVGLQSITYSDSKVTNKALLSDSVPAFIDSTVPQLWLPDKVCTAFEKAFGLQYNSTVNRYLVNDTLHDQLSQQNASVAFTLGTSISGGATVKIVLPYDAFDLSLGPPIIDNSTKYFPLRRANESQITLGRTFLQESYLVVDYERSNFSVSQCLFEGNKPSELIGIAPAHNDSKSPLSTGAIVGIVIALAVVLALSGLGAFFFIRHRKRKRKLEEEKKQIEEEEAIDPRSQKAELAGIPKPQLNELYGEYKPGVEADTRDVNEMEGSHGVFGNDAKLRAEMEGSRGGAEMDVRKSRMAVRKSTKNAPIEMWAGSHGLYDDQLSPHAEESSRPSPPSKMPSSGSGRPSPSSLSSNPRDRRFSWRRRQLSGHSMTQDGSSGISSPTDDLPLEDEIDRDGDRRQRSRPRYPPKAVTSQDISPQSSKSNRIQRGDNLTRRLEQASRYQGTSHLSVSSPTSESDTSERRHSQFNTRFGSQPRSATHHSSLSSPSSDDRSRRKYTTSRSSPRPGVSSPSEGSKNRLYYDSWTSRASHSAEPSPGISSPSSTDERRSGPGGFF